MKGILDVAYVVLKYGLGAWLGLIGICAFVFLFFWVIGLLAIWYRKRNPPKPLIEQVRDDFRRQAEVRFGKNTL